MDIFEEMEFSEELDTTFWDSPAGFHLVVPDFPAPENIIWSNTDLNGPDEPAQTFSGPLEDPTESLSDDSDDESLADIIIVGQKPRPVSPDQV